MRSVVDRTLNWMATPKPLASNKAFEDPDQYLALPKLRNRLRHSTWGRRHAIKKVEIMSRKMVLLTWGHSNPRTAKTATGLLRYCPDECVAVFDPDNAGRSARELLETGGDTPIIAKLEEAPGADTLVLGIAPPGGRIPIAWRAVMLEAIDRGMNLLSGLHDFLSDDPELVRAAAAKNVKITDVRKNRFRQIARREGINPNCLRIHTVGHDCSVGKMVVSLELARGLKARGRDAQFVATGQTGIMVAGAGLPLDCIVADFVSGGQNSLSSTTNIMKSSLSKARAA